MFRGQAWMLPTTLVVAALIPLIYFKFFSFPFVANDWGVLNTLIHHEPDQLIAYTTVPWATLDDPQWRLWKLFYRPLGAGYLMAAFQLFGQNPLGFHCVALLLLFCTSMLAGIVAKQLTRDSLIAGATAILYAASVNIHFEPLYWIEGVYDVWGAFWFLLTVSLFLRGSVKSSALAFLVALLFKEATVILPLILLALRIAKAEPGGLREGLRSQWKALWPHYLVWAAYGVIKVVVVSAGTAPDVPAYAIEPLGFHLVLNGLLYGLWSIESVLPAMLAGEAAYVAGLIGFIALVGYSIRRKALRLPGFDRPLGKALLIWYALALAPVMVLPNMTMKYYLTYALVPLLIGFLMLARALAGNADRRLRLAFGLIIAFHVIGSGIYAYQKSYAGLNEKDTFGVNLLVKRGTTVTMVRRYLLEQHPTLPDNATLVFSGVDTYSFFHAAGPQIWYDNATLRVYEAESLTHTPDGVFAGGQNQPAQRLDIRQDSTFIVELDSAGRLQGRPLEDLGPLIEQGRARVARNAAAEGTLGWYVDALLP